jgi:RNA polymerase sigma-32 factor
MERRLSSRDLSYDPAPDADEEEESWSPAAYLPAPDADPALAVEHAEWDDDVSDKVAAAMAQLDERSQAILRARWMSESKATLHDLADEYGVSAERIRQIEANAIKKLRKLVAVDET